MPAQRPSREAAETLSQAVFTTVPSGRTFYYTVRRGDTLQRVAARYGVTAQELEAWNGIGTDALCAGTAAARHERRRAGRARPADARSGRWRPRRAGEQEQTAAKPAAAKPVDGRSGKPRDGRQVATAANAVAHAGRASAARLNGRAAAVIGAPASCHAQGDGPRPSRSR